MIIRKRTALPQESEFVKVVVDISHNLLAYGCELHMDCAEELLADGSTSDNLWGANIYPKDKTIEYTSMINIRPKDNNRSMEIQLPEIREKVKSVIESLLTL